MFPIVYKPPAKSHIVTDKKVYAANLLIVGRSKHFDCINDVTPNNLSDTSSSMNTFGAGNNKKGFIGLVWPTFIGSDNNVPDKPWTGIMSYNQVGGEMIVTNVTFANFREQSCDNHHDSAIASSSTNDDGQHPVSVQGMNLYNVSNNSKVFIHRPNKGKINPSDCVDMDCDGLKKNLLKDLDGSFLGNVGDVISQSEFGWGDQQRGL